MGKIEDLLGLEFKLETKDETYYSIYIFLTIDNKTSKDRSIDVSKATYVTSKREQLEQDFWVNGYMQGEGNIKPNSFIKAGLAFEMTKLKNVLEKDNVYIPIKLVKEGVELNLRFQKTRNTWILEEIEKVDIEIELTPKQLEKKLLKGIEKLEAFEERLEITIENISININDDSMIKVFGELHSNSGTALNEDIKIECIVYDNQDRVIYIGKEVIYSSRFFGFEAFLINIYHINIAKKVSKIRLYPKKN